MSKEYRYHYIRKITNEAADALKALPNLNIVAFIRSRAKHYGIRNKYLPPDFKTERQPIMANTEGTEINTPNDPATIETTTG